MAGSKNKTVWVIVYEQGEHSDYLAEIHSVWDSKEAAENCVDELLSGYSVVEIPLNTPGDYWTGG